MSLTQADKRWLVRLAQIVVYLVHLKIAYQAGAPSRAACKNYFAELLRKEPE